MVHTFKMFDKYIALDVNSGCVHSMDKLCFDIINFMNVKHFKPDSGEARFKLIDDLKYDYDRSEIGEALDDIIELYKNGLLWSEDDYNFDKSLKKDSPIKAMCLHVSHDCNLRCRYCFADEGKYHSEKGELMTAETGKKAMDFLVKHSGNRRNLEVDFFGGEPLLNFDVVKETVEYAHELEKKYGKNFRFTITTNGILLDDDKIDYINKNMGNIVLSIDGRKEVNDRMRYRADGSGSYDRIVPLFQKVAESRNQDKYYVRGTFTRKNLDFSNDVIHLADLGFKQISIEPVVCDTETDYSLREEDLPQIFEEYEKLVKEYVKRIKDGSGFNFFHFMIDLDEGPCIIKRLSGCGCGCEYLAVAPNGDVYPCHQFVGHEEYKMGSLHDDKGLNAELRSKFEDLNVYTKPKCKDCFAKFFCSGGCTANASLINGDMKEPHKLSCEMMKKRVECSLYAKAALSD